MTGATAGTAAPDTTTPDATAPDATAPDTTAAAAPRPAPAHRRPRRLGDRLGERSGPVFALLRAVHPVVSTRRLAVVTLAQDVREVLGDGEHFTVAHYAPRMAEITGPFVLGLDDTPLYRHDHAALQAATRPGDAALLSERVLAAARERVDAAGGGGLDAVADVADPVLADVAAGHLGVPRTDPGTALRWSRDLFERIFLDAGDDAGVRARALSSAAELRPHVDELIASRKAAPAVGGAPDDNAPDDVLGRLLAAQGGDGGLHDLAIRHNLIGLFTGWLPTASKALAMVVDELLRRPDRLRDAQAAARRGDVETLRRHVFEALRFRPQTWALVRVCAADTPIAVGTSREAVLRRGARVLVGTRSAMFDRSAVRRPRAFLLDRPPTDYLHFGAGLHTCFGEQLNRAQLPALAQALLERDDLARAGALAWDGPFPLSLPVRPARARGRS